MAALGLALTLLVGAAWITAVPYLLARLDLPSPVRLAWVDGPHVYVGLVGGLILVAKVLRVGLRGRVLGVPDLEPWQRWLSLSMLVLYGAILVTGVLLLLPVRGLLYAGLAQLHLLASVWAVTPTTWHIWHYRLRAGPYLRRMLAWEGGRRFWQGVGLIALPLVAIGLLPRDASQPATAMAGSAWAPAGLGGIALSHLATTPDGALLAGGDRVYVTRDGARWRAIEFDPGTTQPAGYLPGGHGHGPAHSTATVVQSLAASPLGVYAGTSRGLFFSATLDGPLADIGLPGQNVEAIAIDPEDPAQLWTVSTAGAMFSTDGGRHWASQSTGIAQREALTTIAYAGPRAFASDTTGVYEWGAGSWQPSSNQASVISLTASAGALYAASSTGELRVLRDGWQPLTAPGLPHIHQGVVHAAVQGVAGSGGRLFAAGTQDGVSASSDGGLTWSPLGAGVPAGSAAQVVAFGGALWVATGAGALRHPLLPARPAPVAWWALLLAGALVTSAGALARAGLERVDMVAVEQERSRRRAERDALARHPFHGVERYLRALVEESRAPIE